MTPQESEKLVNDYLLKKGLPLGIALAFPDVFIVDKKSRVDKRSDIGDLSGLLARHVRLNIPVVSANMADITESKMATALARLGGLGFIHQFLPIRERADEVKKVKRADNEIIENPWKVNENDSLDSALALIEEKQTSGVLVVDDKEKLSGILTGRDIRFINYRYSESTADLRVKDVMTKAPLVTAEGKIEIRKAAALLHEHKVEKLPLVDKEGRVIGLMTAKDILKKLQFPKAVRDKKGRLLVGAAVGLSKYFLDEVAQLVEAETDVVLVDTARANSSRTFEEIKAIRKKFPDLPIVAGNVDNAEGALGLIEAGVDCVKVGIGPGSACKTRVETGIGVPQLSAIAGCAAVAGRFKIPVIADGGVKEGGDLAKALVAGANAVMLGGLLAGTEETPGDVYYDAGEKVKYYRGSAGLDSQVSRIDKGDLDKVRAPEGITRKVLYKGQKAEEVIAGLMENLRSAMSYTDSMTIQEFQENRFRHQSFAGYLEGQPKK